MEKESELMFSIITVCYNEEKTIRETMESVLKQKWQDFEYIIVDGASTDSTGDIVREYQKADDRIKWYSEQDNGIYNAMNKGIDHATGDFVYFLNAGDTFYDDEVLKNVAENILLSQADIVIGSIVKKDRLGLEMIQSYESVDKIYQNFKKGINICHQALFAAKDTLKNGFDEQFEICADYDWLCQQMNSGRHISLMSLIVTNFDTYGVSSQAKNCKQLKQEVFKAMKKNFLEMDVAKLELTEKEALKEKKRWHLYKYMNDWLHLKQKGISLVSFFLDKGIDTIAIYGFHYMGQRLYEELKNSQINILYAIDRKMKYSNWVIPIIGPDDVLENVDAVIITPICDFQEIQDELSRKLECPLISLEEVLLYFL